MEKDQEAVDRVPSLDEDGARAVAQDLVQESANGAQRERKKRRVQLLEWMMENERGEIDVGAGTAEIKQTKQTVKSSDLMFMALRDEPYNWSEEQIEELVQIMASTKEQITETKPALKIRLARKKKNRKRKRSADEDAECSSGQMDVQDILAGRSKPDFELTTVLGPISGAAVSD